MSWSQSGVAWQKKIRDERASSDADADIFGRWWETIDTSVSNSTVRRITKRTAGPFIEKYEWLGTMPAIVLDCFGLFFDGVLGGVAVYSPEYAENLGVWDRYGFTGKIICLSRGACAHWTPTNSASKLISSSISMLDNKYEVVTATVDADAGEIGTIYQACNWHYVGQMSYGGKRASYQDHQTGRLVSGRQAKRKFGTRGAGNLEKMGVTGVKSADRKGRYFFFRGSHKNRRTHLDAIRHLIKPYPKRLPIGGVQEP